MFAAASLDCWRGSLAASDALIDAAREGVNARLRRIRGFVWAPHC